MPTRKTRPRRRHYLPVEGDSDMTKRRYEILLPAEFNDGRLVADACPLCIPDSLSEVSDPDPWLGRSWEGCREREDAL